MTLLDKIEAQLKVCDRATPGPWKLWANQVRYDKGGDSDVDKSVLIADTYYENEKGQQRTNDAAFIAISRTALPQALRALKIAIDNLRHEGDAYGMMPAKWVCDSDCPGCAAEKEISALLGERGEE